MTKNDITLDEVKEFWRNNVFDLSTIGHYQLATLDHIEQLEADACNWEIEATILKGKLIQAEKERDAAVEDAKLGTACDTCFYNENPSLPNPCSDCGGGFPMWQWRGPCAENTSEER